MKQVLILMMILGVFKCHGQNQEAIWMFGSSNILDFTATTPVTGSVPNAGGTPPAWGFDQGTAICDNSRNLLFWVKMRYSNNPEAANYKNVFTPAGNPMLNSELMSNVQGNGMPVIFQWPDQPNKYFICYMKNGGLRYSVVDLSLDGGSGAIDPAFKNVAIGGNNQLIEEKMMAIAGCDCIWLVVRSRNSGKFISYKIDRAGFNVIGIPSEVGTLPFAQYGSDLYAGVIKSSVDGSKIGSANGAPFPGSQPVKYRGGLEIYDFEKCSGTISNALLLDTGAYYGVCFSPNGTKLYATQTFGRRVYQYDLSLPTLAAIKASKTLILVNPYSSIYEDEYMLGELKRGLDGQIYLGNGVCSNAPYINGMHVISQPDNPGLTCNPVLNNIIMGGGSACPGLHLPADVAEYHPADTVKGIVHNLVGCFVDTVAVTASTGSCYRWLDGVNNKSRSFTNEGQYVCFYNDNNCQVVTDTYSIRFIKAPIIGPTTYSCKNVPSGTMYFLQNPSQDCSYQWLDMNGALLKSGKTQNGDTIKGLHPGVYTVSIHYPGGCDTTITFNIKALPEPVAGFTVNDIACIGDTLQIENFSTAPVIKWYYRYGSSSLKNPDIQLWHEGQEPITQIVTNIEGCSDTMKKIVTVHDFKIQIEVENSPAKKGQPVTIRSYSDETYQVLKWEPVYLFKEQTRINQVHISDTPRRVSVFGVSDYGCRDSVSIMIDVDPYVFVPSAFSPNGDGKNDRFRPISSGAPIFITYFQIFNRWGTEVYSAQGPSAINGWDGMYKGIACDVGTYYYSIQIETPQREIIKQTGDVTLVR